VVSRYHRDVFGRSRVQISARRPAILIEDFSEFPQFLEESTEVRP
jgi:hypothetical protein